MSLLEAVLNGFEYAVVAYVAVLALVSAVIGYAGVRSLTAHARRRPTTALADMLANDYYDAISILVPAYNEERTIVASVRSMLNLQHPLFDVIVVNDGSTDRTLDELIDSFSLIEVPIAHDETIRTEPLRRMFRSLTHANLTVVDKDYGGRADAHNAALNLARRALVCIAPSSTTLDGQALIRGSRIFVEDERVIAVAGAPRPADRQERAGKRWVNRIQRVQFARDRLVQAAGWAEAGALTNTTGFAMFNRHALLRVGGWWTGTAADDIDMAIKLHRHYRDSGRAYRIAYMPDPVCHATATPTIGDLFRRRHRHATGSSEVLARHTGMLAKRRYGPVGMVALPHRWLVDVCSPVIETGAYAYIAASAALGRLNVAFAVAFFALTVGAGIVSSLLALGAEALVAPRFAGITDRFALLVTSIVEQVVVRPVSALIGIRALLPARSFHRPLIRSAQHHGRDSVLRAAS